MICTRKGPIFLGFLAHAVNDGSVYMVLALLPFFVQSMHITYAQAGFIWTLLNLAASIPQPLFGIMADRGGRFGLAALGLALATTALATVGSLNDYALVLLVVVLGGIGTAICHPVAATIVAAASGAKRGAGMSAFSLGGNVGFGLAPLIFPPLLIYFGNIASWIILPVGLVTALALFLGTRTLPRPQPKSHRSSPQPPVPLLPLSLLTCLVTLRSWVYSTFIAFLPMYMVYRGLSLEDGSRVLALVLIFAAIGSVLGGIISDYFSPKWLTLISMAMLVPLLGLAFQTQGILSIVLLGVSGGFLWASFAVTVVMAQKLLPTRQALASGLMLGFGIGLGGLGGIATGWLIDNYGMQTAMISQVIVALLGALSMVPYSDKEWLQTYNAQPRPA